MNRAIGPADEFWRLRIVRVDMEAEPDLDWRDDVLYRVPPSAEVVPQSLWRIEAVDLDDELDPGRLLGAFETEAEALAFLDTASEDLREMTRSEYEERYLCE